jgi:hypothetical protein
MTVVISERQHHCRAARQPAWTKGCADLSRMSAAHRVSGAGGVLDRASRPGNSTAGRPLRDLIALLGNSVKHKPGSRGIA